MGIKAWVRGSLRLTVVAGFFLLNLMNDVISIGMETSDPGKQRLFERYVLTRFDVINFIMFISVFLLVLSFVVKEQNQDMGKYGMFQFLRLGRGRYGWYKLLLCAMLCAGTSTVGMLQSAVSNTVAGLFVPVRTYLFLSAYQFVTLLATTLLAMWVFLLVKNTAIAYLISVFFLIFIKAIFSGACFPGAQKTAVLLSFGLFALLSLMSSAVFWLLSGRADYITGKIKE